MKQNHNVSNTAALDSTDEFVKHFILDVSVYYFIYVYVAAHSRHFGLTSI